ncbi:MAG: HEAT repeat domain-containing protein [Anaerolineae bacterium]|jgi:HEAT repeat protein|nr:HEAT repeat domain-containing protein [Anaerolineae bacterium]
MSRTVIDWIEALKSEDSKAIKEAVRALGYLGQTALAPLLEALQAGSIPPEPLAEAFRQIGAASVEPLTALLTSSTRREQQQQIIHILGLIRDNQAVMPLIILLEIHTDPAVRASIADALGNFTDLRAIPPLLSLLADDTPPVQARAAVALGGFTRDPRVVNALLTGAAHPQPIVRSGVIQGLAKAGTDERIVRMLNRMVEDSDPDVRQLAAAAIQYQRGDVMAFQRITSINDSAVQHAVARIQEDGRLDEDDMEAMRNSNPRVRARLLEMVTEDGKTSAVNLIMPGLNDINPAVRQSAIDALVRLGAKIVPTLLEVVQTHKSRFTRAGAAEALGLIGEGSAVAVLVSALKDAEPQVRAAAAEALSHFPAEDALIRGLKAAARDADADVREQVLLALKKFGQEPDKENVIGRFFRRLTGN